MKFDATGRVETWWFWRMSSNSYVGLQCFIAVLVSAVRHAADGLFGFLLPVAPSLLTSGCVDVNHHRIPVQAITIKALVIVVDVVFGGNLSNGTGIRR